MPDHNDSQVVRSPSDVSPAAAAKAPASPAPSGPEPTGSPDAPVASVSDLAGLMPPLRERREAPGKLQPPHVEPLLGSGETIFERIRTAPHAQGYLVMFIYCMALILAGFIFEPLPDVLAGSVRILLTPGQLLTDYMEISGIGATFLNSGGVTLLTLIILFLKKIRISGSILAGLFTVSGFSMFGKNLFNTIPIMLGGLIYVAIKRIPYSRIAIISLFSTALGPLVSVICFGLNLPPVIALPLGYTAGIVVGLIMPALATSFLRFHMGYNLYNVGFTAGIIGTFATAMLRMFGLNVSQVLYLSHGNNVRLGVLMAVLCLLLIGMGMVYDDRPWSTYRELLRHSGQLLTDFIAISGIRSTLANMGLMGLIGLGYTLLAGGQLNGPTLGGILTVIGFSAFGVHPKNALPVMGGVVLASLAVGVPVSLTSSIIAVLFGTTLSPIAGHYGPIAGAVAGFSHMAMVVNVASLHGGVNLYNNGFSGGFVAAVLVPILEDFKRKRRR